MPGCGCLIVLMGTAFPRFALIFTWIFSNLVSRAFDTWVIPFLGLLVLPYTTLFYVFAYRPVDGVTGIGWFFVALGFLLDIGALSGGGRYGRNQYNQRYA